MLRYNDLRRFPASQKTLQWVCMGLAKPLRRFRRVFAFFLLSSGFLRYFLSQWQTLMRYSSRAFTVDYLVAKQAGKPWQRKYPRERRTAPALVRRLSRSFPASSLPLSHAGHFLSRLNSMPNEAHSSSWRRNSLKLARSVIPFRCRLVGLR